jgi:hypothetical protein
VLGPHYVKVRTPDKALFSGLNVALQALVFTSCDSKVKMGINQPLAPRFREPQQFKRFGLSPG